ncbi:MAG: pyridoxal phosphate-dependent class II aminotransferase [Candidatus Omnitrophica bacterium]|nr:pyridoxal phosphate-dependent class II aminotransferase [Candidatus Omnitrophota bacterium]
MHGGDFKNFSRKFGKPENEILDFSSNINPYGIPNSVALLYPKLMAELENYPDPKAEDMRREIARHFPVFPENVIAANGSLAVLALAIQTLAPRRAVLIEPCFSEYRELLNQRGTEVRNVLLREGDQFEFRLPEILNTLRGTDLIVIGHPNSPTGTALKREELLELISEARRQNVFVIVDEAFSDWTPEISVASEIKDNSYFLVAKSLTKFYALAGIRSGFGLGARRLIEKMQSRQEMWSCNRLAQRLSIAALQDMEFRRKSFEWFREESVVFAEKINGLREFRAYPSLANFFLVKILPPLIKNETALTALPDFLGRKGIYVREVVDYTGLDNSYFRASVRLRHENEVLIEALKEWARLRTNPRLAEIIP